jgi:hypothetical protein
MTGRPQKLDEFAAYYANFSQVMGGRDNIERRYSIVVSMYEMLTEYGGKVPPADQVRDIAAWDVRQRVAYLSVCLLIS